MNGTQGNLKFGYAQSAIVPIGTGKKQCTKCGAEKLLEYFKYVKKTGKYCSWCRECSRIDTDRWKKNNTGAIREYRVDYYKINKLLLLEQAHERYRKNRQQNLVKFKEYRKEKPERCIAKRVVEGLLQRGDVIRPTTCSVCGSEGPVDGHHDDYSKPSEIRWMCRSCHHCFHRQKGDINGKDM